MGLVALAGLFGGCGTSEGGAAGGGAGGNSIAGCLSAEQVREQVDRIAEGFETSASQVEAKQEEIRAVQAEAC